MNIMYWALALWFVDVDDELVPWVPFSPFWTWVVDVLDIVVGVWVGEVIVEVDGGKPRERARRARGIRS